MKLIDLEKAKHKIIMDVVTSREYRYKVRNILFKKGWTDKSKFLDDVIQEVTTTMLRKDSQELFDIYIDNPKRIFAIAIGVTKNCFRINPNGYTNHSFYTKMSYNSNLTSKTSDSDDIWDVNDGYTPEYIETGNADDLNETNENESVIYQLMEFLDQDEIEILEKIMSGKYSRTPTATAKKDALFNKIRGIAEANNIPIRL